jgi:hypothetical protein
MGGQFSPGANNGEYLMIRTSLFISILVFYFIAMPVFAEEGMNSKTKPLSPDEIKGYLNDLNSPDIATQLASFDKMINSDNPTLVELGLQKAFGGKDPTLRAAAFRAAFKTVKDFHVNLELKPNATEQEKKDLANNRTKVDITNIIYDYPTGKFFKKNTNYGGSMNGLVVSFNSGSCAGNLENQEGTQRFVGDVNCYVTTYTGTFLLR